MPGQDDCILWRFSISYSFYGKFLEFIANLIEFNAQVVQVVEVLIY